MAKKSVRKRLTKSLMLKVCDQLCRGRSLRSICDSSDAMPHWVTVLQSAVRDDEIHEMYARALAIRAEVLADEIHDLASQPLPPGIDPKLANAYVQNKRLEIDSKKWTFAKMQPRGVRGKKENVESSSGSITLVWGQDVQQPKTIEHETTPTGEVVTLVPNDG